MARIIIKHFSGLTRPAIKKVRGGYHTTPNIQNNPKQQMQLGLEVQRYDKNLFIHNNNSFIWIR